MGVIARLNRLRNPPASRCGAQGRQQKTSTRSILNADRADPAAVTRSEYEPPTGSQIQMHTYSYKDTYHRLIGE